MTSCDQFADRARYIESANRFLTWNLETRPPWDSCHPDLPDVDHDTWPTLPRATRLQVVTRHWAEHGFGTPYAVYLLYLIKIALYVAAPAAIISLTPAWAG